LLKRIFTFCENSVKDKFGKVDTLVNNVGISILREIQTGGHG